jgi:uncharacterized RDD family membrane protein YckC
MGSALLNTTSAHEFASSEEAARAEMTPQDSAEALRAQVAERLAAHRRRRGDETAQASKPEQPRQANTRSAQIAATVAERYAKTQSYRAFLAAEAERATQQARAAAEVAALNAEAVAAAQQRLMEALDQHASAEARQKAEALRRADTVVAHQIAARNEAAAAELNLWPDLDAVQHEGTRSETARPARTPRRTQAASSDAVAGQSRNASTGTASGLTVRLYENAASGAYVDLGHSNRAAIGSHTNRHDHRTRNEAEANALDEEIAFRQAPVFEEQAGPPVPLPANLIQFPRQLVASRRARPRYAEGPLREEEDAPGDGQLRIFEVDPAQISTQPAADSTDTSAMQWTSIWLDTPFETGNSAAQYDANDGFAQRGEYVPHGEYAPNGMDAFPEVAARPGPPPIQPASIQRRVLASAINTAIVSAGALAFAATSLALFAHGVQWHADGSRLQAMREIALSVEAQTGLLPLQAAALGASAYALLALLYHALFFWFSDATPGMRAARIALCTFDGEDPTRRAVRRRLGAMLLSGCPLGLGFALAALDEDRLTWHDRMTKMYLRSY